MWSFAYPWAWTALIPAAWVGYYLWYRKPMPGILFPSVKTARTAARGARRMPPVLWLLYMLTAVLLVAALARPRIGDEKLIIRAQGIDMIMVLDLSGSMQAYDVPDGITSEGALESAINTGRLRNRLDVAKKELSGFITSRPNDRIGLIGFAEFGYNLAPPTLDHDWLINSLSVLKPGIIGDATGIASPVANGVKRLAASTAPRRVLVLFTDGSNNVAHRLTPRQTAELAKEKGVVIYTVGIGSPNAYVLQEGFFGKRYVPYRNEFDEKLMRDMAEITGGRYFHAADGDGLAKVMSEINLLEKTNFEQPRYVEYREFAPSLAWGVALLLLLAVFLENTRWRTIP